MLNDANAGIGHGDEQKEAYSSKEPTATSRAADHKDGI